ncbi:hypothetical protein Tco_0491478 [Tanacetum coccineum]
MPWRHSSLVINDLKPLAGSYSREYVRRLSAHVVKLRGLPEGVLVYLLWVSTISCACLSGPDLKFKRSIFMILGLLYKAFLSIVPPVAIDAAIPDPTPKDLAAGTPSAKVMAKAEASKKQKSSTFSATPSIIAKRTRSAMAQSYEDTSRPNLFVRDDYDDDDDDENNQSESSTPSTAEGPSTRDSRGKAIMSDVADASFESANCSRTSANGVVASSYEMVRIEALTNDQLAAKTSVLHCLMMSHIGELLARYRGLLKSHHDYVQSADSQLRGLQEKCSAYQGLESKKLDHLTTEAAHVSSALNQSTVLEAERDTEILRLKAFPSEFASFFQSGFQSLV